MSQDPKKGRKCKEEAHTGYGKKEGLDGLQEKMALMEQRHSFEALLCSIFHCQEKKQIQINQ